MSTRMPKLLQPRPTIDTLRPPICLCGIAVTERS
jgi:hypothetical protein